MEPNRYYYNQGVNVLDNQVKLLVAKGYNLEKISANWAGLDEAYYYKGLAYSDVYTALRDGRFKVYGRENNPDSGSVIRYEEPYALLEFVHSHKGPAKIEVIEGGRRWFRRTLEIKVTDSAKQAGAIIIG